MEDYYAILGVEKTADPETIKKCYRKLSLKHHPDRGGNEETFKRISEAYETLGDSTKRQQYDMQRNNPFMAGMGGMGGMSGTHDDILKMFFGGGMHGMPGMFGNMGEDNYFNMGQNDGTFPNVRIFRNGVPVNIVRKPQSINKNLEITMEQSYTGGNIPIEITRTILVHNEKKSENETIYVDIPMGIDNNEIITIKERGNIVNEFKGDVKVKIIVNNTTDFIRKGMDLIYNKEISFKESLIGFSFNLKHLSGKNYIINNNTKKIVTSDHKNLIKHMGMKRERKHPASPIVGDLIIQFKVIYPDEITDKQREELKKIL